MRPVKIINRKNFAADTVLAKKFRALFTLAVKENVGRAQTNSAKAQRTLLQSDFSADAIVVLPPP
jgi:hypothetical protein